MPQPASRPRTPRFVRRAAASIAMVLGAIACMQCRPVTDAVTGVDTAVHTGSMRPQVCLHGCAARAGRAHREEAVRHRRAMKWCRGDRACKISERIAHRERLTALAAALRDCRRGCYGEGWGSGGR